MTKRMFLKLLSLGTFGAFVPVSVPTPTPNPKQYLTTCTWHELIGLRFMLGKEEWMICGKEVRTGFRYLGQDVANYRLNKYWARPLNSRDVGLLCCFMPYSEGNTVHYDRVHLEPNTFYRA